MIMTTMMPMMPGTMTWSAVDGVCVGPGEVVAGVADENAATA
jgi:hypothetical protein